MPINLKINLHVRLLEEMERHLEGKRERETEESLSRKERVNERERESREIGRVRERVGS